MQMIFCPNCGNRSGFKRDLGCGTLFMVLVTFGLWLLMIPFYPVRCINCGLTRASAHWENASRGGKIFIVCMWVCIVLFVLHTMRDSTPRPTEPPTQEVATPSAINPHEARLEELRKKREGIGWKIALEREMTKKLILDAANLSAQPFPDPDERQFLMDKMDEQHKRAAELLEQLNLVNAEIAKEEGQLQPDSEPNPPPEPKAQVAERPSDTPKATNPPSTTESIPAPPVEAARPTSGVLCNWPVAIPHNGEVKFRNLPSDRLKFTFDHVAWLPRIQREPDGTQTLIMQSIKPGVQTMCDIRWEVVQ